jgi:endonuclease YncB( thermonuclease family)
LQRLIGNAEVRCRTVERDQHDRHLAFCTAGGRDLNAEMVRSGYAFAYGGDYRAEEAEARAAHRGLWSGEFERPRDWREKNMRR